MANGTFCKSILLVDQETLFGEGLRHLFEAQTPYKVSAIARDLNEALSLLDRDEPHFLLTETRLPGPSGLELIRQVKQRSSTSLPILMMSAPSSDLIQPARSAGARGFLTKRDTFESLVACLEHLEKGGIYLSPSLELIQHQIDQNAECSADPLESLSPREREIFHLLADGMQNASIAKRLFISPRTVETHRARVVRKLGLRSNSELIRFAIRNGLAVA